MHLAQLSPSLFLFYSYSLLLPSSTQSPRSSFSWVLSWFFQFILKVKVIRLHLQATMKHLDLCQTIGIIQVKFLQAQPQPGLSLAQLSPHFCDFFVFCLVITKLVMYFESTVKLSPADIQLLFCEESVHKPNCRLKYPVTSTFVLRIRDSQRQGDIYGKFEYYCFTCRNEDKSNQIQSKDCMF